MNFAAALGTCEFDAFYTFNEDRLAAATRAFTEHFPGRVLYAVKANPLPQVLRTVLRNGVAGFDIASIAEACLVRSIDANTRSCFMNPAKPRRDVERAFRELGIRDYVVDCEAELRKLLDVLPPHDPEVRIFVRFSVGQTSAIYDLASKFGASPSEARRLLGLVAQSRWTTGLSFHTGSQTLTVEPYLHAIKVAADIIESTLPAPVALDIGGGFPGQYLNTPCQSPSAILKGLIETIHASSALDNIELLCEPGRALVHDSMSLFCRITLRKGEALYCGAGIYSGLLSAHQFLQVPARAWRDGCPIEGEDLQDFIIFGPTCDSLDRLGFSYSLPWSLEEGDWLEFQHVGAYSENVRCSFNGFSVDRLVSATDGELAIRPKAISQVVTGA
jgi:ornithine decarboxylase